MSDTNKQIRIDICLDSQRREAFFYKYSIFTSYPSMMACVLEPTAVYISTMICKYSLTTRFDPRLPEPFFVIGLPKIFALKPLILTIFGNRG